MYEKTDDKASPKLHRQGQIRLFYITFNILTDIFFKKGNVTVRQKTEQHAIPSIELQKTNQQGADIPPNHHAPSYHQSKNEKEKKQTIWQLNWLEIQDSLHQNVEQHNVKNRNDCINPGASQTQNVCLPPFLFFFS